MRIRWNTGDKRLGTKRSQLGIQRRKAATRRSTHSQLLPGPGAHPITKSLLFAKTTARPGREQSIFNWGGEWVALWTPKASSRLGQAFPFLPSLPTSRWPCLVVPGLLASPSALSPELSFRLSSLPSRPPCRPVFHSLTSLSCQNASLWVPFPQNQLTGQLI